MVLPETKRCSSCGQIKPREEFGLQWNKKYERYYLTGRCKECLNSYHRENYQHKPGRKSTTEARYLRHVAVMRELKNCPCMDCGGVFPSYVMDFDHVRGEKLFNIAEEMGRSLKSLLAEAEKCDVVCSNCHRIRTYERRMATEKSVA